MLRFYTQEQDAQQGACQPNVFRLATAGIDSKNGNLAPNVWNMDAQRVVLSIETHGGGRSQSCE